MWAAPGAQRPRGHGGRGPPDPRRRRMSEQQPAAFRSSPQQERLWAEHPDGPPGRTQAIVRIDGALSTEQVRDALERVVARHEILRTTFVRRPGISMPLQAVHEQLAPAWNPDGAGSAADVAREELAAP